MKEKTNSQDGQDVGINNPNTYGEVGQPHLNPSTNTHLKKLGNKWFGEFHMTMGYVPCEQDTESLEGFGLFIQTVKRVTLDDAINIVKKNITPCCGGGCDAGEDVIINKIKELRG